MNAADLTLVKQCAAIMDLRERRIQFSPDRLYVLVDYLPGVELYDPFTNDKQAMALVKKLRLGINPPDSPGGLWMIGYECAINTDLNRAIVEAGAAEWRRTKRPA